MTGSEHPTTVRTGTMTAISRDVADAMSTVCMCTSLAASPRELPRRRGRHARELGYASAMRGLLVVRSIRLTCSGPTRRVLPSSPARPPIAAVYGRQVPQTGTESDVTIAFARVIVDTALSFPRMQPTDGIGDAVAILPRDHRHGFPVQVSPLAPATCTPVTQR